MSRSLTMLLAVALLAAACSEPADPTLSAVIDEAGETTGFTDFTAGVDKSFGVFVCSNDGAVEIESVEPIHSEGEIEVLGSYVYVNDERYVGAAHGFPPAGLDESKIVEVVGATVDSDCENPDGDDRVQLIVGARRTGAAGGVIDGLLVTTTGNELEIPLTILMCGNQMEYCEVLDPGDDT